LQTDPAIAVLGRVKFRSYHEKLGIRPDDRRRHLAIIGKTGMGKTTLLHHLMASDVRSGHGLALLDPHGDLADALLAAIPSRRTNVVVQPDTVPQRVAKDFRPHPANPPVRVRALRRSPQSHPQRPSGQFGGCIPSQVSFHDK
jgi:DNA helicase HerA-like ATPase